MRWAVPACAVYRSAVLAPGLILGLGLGLGCLTAGAQPVSNSPDWAESQAPPPPKFDASRLIAFNGPISSSLVYGVDAASIQVSGSDGLVRYVLVATSASGAKNVMYEAIRCSTGEFKTYARYSVEGGWSPVGEAIWRSMYANIASKHALYFAQAGACDMSAMPSTVNLLVSRLKSPTLNEAR